MTTQVEELLAAAVKIGYTITHWKRDPFDVLASHPDAPGIEFHLYDLTQNFAPSQVPPPPPTSANWCAEATEAVRASQGILVYNYIRKLTEISIAAMNNLPENTKNRLPRTSPYWSQAYEDVCKVVDCAIAHRERAKEMTVTLNELRDILHMQSTSREALTTFVRDLVKCCETQEKMIDLLRARTGNLTEALDTAKREIETQQQNHALSENIGAPPQERTSP